MSFLKLFMGLCRLVGRTWWIFLFSTHTHLGYAVVSSSLGRDDWGLGFSGVCLLMTQWNVELADDDGLN